MLLDVRQVGIGRMTILVDAVLRAHRAQHASNGRFVSVAGRPDAEAGATTVCVIGGHIDEASQESSPMAH